MQTTSDYLMGIHEYIEVLERRINELRQDNERLRAQVEKALKQLEKERGEL